MRYLLGLDNGGTFSKAAVFDENGQQLSVASVPSVTYSPKPGYAQRNMEELWQANCQAIRLAISRSGIDPNHIAGISFSGHGKGLYLLGRDGKPAYDGIPSTDARAWKYVEQWNKDGTSARVYPKTFQQILVMQPVALLAWFRDHAPQVLENTRYIFSVNDYIRWCLTGEAAAEYTISSGGNLVNLTTKAYDPELLACFGLEMCLEKLPPLCESTQICGRVTPAAAAQCGLPVGIPCAAGMFDVNACGIASGLRSPEEMSMIAGTWSINEFIRREPLTNGTVALNSMFCIPGYFLIEESSPTSAGNNQWFIDNLLSAEVREAKAAGKSIYDLCNHLVASIEPQDCNLVFLPFLNGSNVHPLAKGSFIGLTAFHEKKHMLRAVYEGIVFSHMTHVKRLLANRSTPKSIRLSGGAANSPVWVQIFADALQIPIDVTSGKELGCLGACMAAGIGAGIYTDYPDAIQKTVTIEKTVYPRQAYREIYEKKYETYCAVIHALEPIWDRFEN